MNEVVAPRVLREYALDADGAGSVSRPAFR